MKLWHAKRVHFFFAMALLLLMATVLASPVKADVLFSTGFETSDGYTLTGTSRFLGYNGWSATSASVVTGAWIYSGSQSAYQNGNFAEIDYTELAFRSVPYTPTAANPIVQASAYFGLVPMASYGSGAPGTTILTGEVLIGQNASGSQVQIGSLLMDAAGGLTWQTASGSANVGGSLGVNTWNKLGIQADFSNGNVEFLLNGNVIAGSTFDSTNITQLNSFEWYNANTHTSLFNVIIDDYYMDNVLIESKAAGSPVPIPGALLFFGPGLVGLAAIRRKFGK